MMTERETPQAIHDSAAEWVARIDRSDADPDALAELEAWLAGDHRRQGAYFRALVAWTTLDRASALRRGKQAEQSEEPAIVIDRNGLLSRRRLLWGGGALAASAAVGAVGLELRPDPTERIATAVGEIRSVPLTDGSLAAVNTRTELAVTMRPHLRRIALRQGEVWFEVAKDRTRPFVVEAGNARIKAVGTAFSVRRTDGGADVQVTEGIVEVWSIDDATNIRRIAAGARTFINDVTGPVQAIEASDAIDRSLSWRTGDLVFGGDTLGHAAAEFNRYNRIQVEVADPALAQEEMVGRFRANEPQAFARAAAEILGARADIRGDKILISRK